jgi:integrase
MLNKRQIDGFTPGDKPARHADGRGLYLLVMPNGAKLWRYDYRLATRKTAALGAYPDVPIETARKRLQAARELVAAGIDPVERKREEHRQARGGDLFRAVAEEWFAKHPKWATKTRNRHRILLDRTLYPIIGNLPVAAIKAPNVLKAAQTLEAAGKISSAYRAVNLAGRILRYATATSRAAHDVTHRLHEALTDHEEEHFAAITKPAEVGALMRAIDSYFGQPSVRYALRLAPLLFVRPVELRHMEKDEIDLDTALWSISAEKMKGRRPHLVPLAPQAVTLIRELLALNLRGRYVFPSPRSHSRPISDTAIGAALQRLGYSSEEHTFHGFRAMARTLIDEELRFQPDVIEVQLAHVVTGALGDTYNRAKYLEERTRMMSAWANYLDTLKAQKP